jgi:predicted phage tail protein
MLSALLVLAGVSSAHAQIRLTAEWDPNTDPYTVGYRLSIGIAPGVYLADIDAGAQPRVPLNLPPGNTYYFVVRAYNAAGQFGPPSIEATIDLSGPPGAPTDFGASISGSRATLTWNPPASGGGATQYLLYVGSTPGAANIVNGFGVGNVLTVSGDLPQGAYYARLRAANPFGAGPFSPEISFQINSGYRPLSPTNLSATWSGTVATLSWVAPTSTVAADVPTSYVIEAGTARGARNIGSFNVGRVTAYSVDVPPGNYYVRVRGVNALGISDPSNEITLQGRGAPVAPHSLSSSGSGGTVNLRWIAPSGSTHAGFVIEVGSAPGLSNLAVVPVGNVITFSTMAPPGTYYVRVRAVNSRGASTPSNEIVVRR